MKKAPPAGFQSREQYEAYKIDPKKLEDGMERIYKHLNNYFKLIKDHDN